MHRFLTILVGLVATTALALALVPLALGESNHNKPTTSETCPNQQYGSPQYIPGDPADVNGDGYVCVKTVAAKSNGDASGPQYIDNTAHNQNG
jgi:hypothetical protein